MSGGTELPVLIEWKGVRKALRKRRGRPSNVPLEVASLVPLLGFSKAAINWSPASFQSDWRVGLGLATSPAAPLPQSSSRRSPWLHPARLPVPALDQPEQGRLANSQQHEGLALHMNLFIITTIQTWVQGEFRFTRLESVHLTKDPLTTAPLR